MRKIGAWLRGWVGYCWSWIGGGGLLGIAGDAGSGWGVDGEEVVLVVGAEVADVFFDGFDAVVEFVHAVEDFDVALCGLDEGDEGALVDGLVGGGAAELVEVVANGLVVFGVVVVEEGGGAPGGRGVGLALHALEAGVVVKAELVVVAGEHLAARAAESEMRATLRHGYSLDWQRAAGNGSKGKGPARRLGLLCGFCCT
jgi:hypothetical protein